MVDYKIFFSKIISSSNDKQNSYLSSIFGLGGAAVMYTAWQIVVSETITKLLFIQTIAMILLSLCLFAVGYAFLGSPNGTKNT